jgi:replicative DNA helicase
LDRSYPAKKAEVLRAFCAGWKDAEYNPDLMETYLRAEQERAVAYDIAVKGLEVFEGKAPFSELVMPEIEPVDSGFEFVETDIRKLKGLQDEKGGLSWRLGAMNNLLGRIPRRTLGCVFARPETGKTTFLASEISWMLYNATDPVVVVCNEEPAEVVLIRYMQALFKVTEAELFSKMDHYQEKWDRHIGQRLLITGDPALSNIRNLDVLLSDVKPVLLVVDQVSKLTGIKDSDRLDLMLGAAFRWLRAAANRHNCAVIGVHQAGSSAENRKYLTMNDMMNSHTSIQAEMDWILGIGMTKDTGTSRYLHTSKDKLPRSNGRNPAMSHGYAEALIEPDIARYVDIGKPKQ